MSLGKITSNAPLRQLPDLALVLAGTLLLCLPAIWNGFPLVYSDTGAYLATAFEGKLPMARPTGYGLFIRYTSLGGNVWLPLVAQSLLFSGLLMRAVGLALPGHNTRVGFAVAMTVIVGLSGMSWYASQLMPDVFTGLVVLGAYVLFMDRALHWSGKVLVGFGLYWFCFSHYSHAALLLAICVVMAAFWLLQKLRRKTLPFVSSRIVWATAPAVLAILTFYCVNYSNGLGWRMTRSSHVFTMARLSETGLLEEYLHETCGYKFWPLCQYADSLPASAADFIWNDRSPFKKTGYWEGSRPGYDSLLSDFFGRGHYVKGYLVESAKAGMSQLAELSVGEGITPYNESSSPYKFFERAMPGRLPSFVASQQFSREFSFVWEKRALVVSMILSVTLILALGAIRWQKMGQSIRWLLVISVFGYVANAFLTGAFANVYSRLQSRVAWLLPLVALLLLLDFIWALRKAT